jgi:hypothetical protein
MEACVFRLSLLRFLILAGLLIPTSWASGTEFVRIPASSSGPSGLLFTQSADTLLPGKIEVGIGAAYEHASPDPDYLINELAATITLGVLDSLEVAARVPYMQHFESHGTERRGIEGGELSLKWRFLDQGQFGLPASGFSLAYFSPIGSKKNEFNTVESWGLKGLFLVSAEFDLAVSPYRHYYFGFYADGGVFIRDLHKPTEEKHGLIDLGILLPLSESSRLQLILEANATVKDQNPLEGNYTALTAALRYVAPSFQLTGGVQHRLKRDEDIKNTDRFVLQAGYLF